MSDLVRDVVVGCDHGPLATVPPVARLLGGSGLHQVRPAFVPRVTCALLAPSGAIGQRLDAPMSNADWKKFLRFLDEAKEEALHARLAKVRSVLRVLKSPEVGADARRAVLLMEQELLFRQASAAPGKGCCSPQA